MTEYETDTGMIYAVRQQPEGGWRIMCRYPGAGWAMATDPRLSAECSCAESLQEVLDAYRARRIELELAGARPFPGVEEVLARVIAAGGDNFICTHRGDSIYELLRQGGVAGYFKEITTSAHHFARKPSPEAVQYLLDKYGMDPAETLMIGDRPLDVEAGQNAGTAGCFFDPDGAAYAPAQHQITDIRALFDVIGC